MSIDATGTLVEGLSIKDNAKNNSQMNCKKYFDLLISRPTRNISLDVMVKREFSALTTSETSVSDSAKSPARSVISDLLLVVTEFLTDLSHDQNNSELHVMFLVWPLPCISNFHFLINLFP